MTANPAASDAELVRAAQAGSQDAFRLLFDRHAAGVAAVCRNRVPSAADVDDAVQEAFARALAKLGQLRSPENFGPWVRSIAIRACMDHHRVARRVIVLDDADRPDVSDGAPQPDEVLVAAERDAAVRASLLQLSPRDRQALWLRHVGEAPVATVASELGMTEGSVRVMLTRARERLRAASAGIPVLVPLGWRQWLRERLQAPTPAFEALVVAVAITAAGAGVLGGAGRDPQVPREREPAAIAAVTVSDTGPAPAARAERRSTQPQSRPAASRPARAAARQETAAPPRALAPVGKRVQVRRQYPRPEESNEMANVSVFTGDGSMDLGVYADDLGPQGAVVAEAAREVLRRASR